EALRWTAEGKTSAEIAQILGVTERTVNFHLSNSMQKLNVNNKISAAIRAVMLGLL
ncbi:LuxR C-terminal-related transcriptional regulator, partial [Acinetobacter baumannii]